MGRAFCSHSDMCIHFAASVVFSHLVIAMEQLRVKFDEVEHDGQCHHCYNEMAEELLAQVGLPA